MKLSPESESLLNRYVDKARDSLRGCRSVDVADVEGSIREHVAAALGDGEGVADTGRVEAILRDLGSPPQWVPEDEIPVWRKALSRLQEGPEDFRLAYLSVLLFGIALFFFMAVRPLEGLIFHPSGPWSGGIVALFFEFIQEATNHSPARRIGVLDNIAVFLPIALSQTVARASTGASLVFLLLSFLVSRSATHLTLKRDELGAQKWLLYPSLAAVYGLCLIVLLFIPAVISSLFLLLAEPGRDFWGPSPASLFFLLEGVFLIAVGAQIRFRREWMQRTFWPFFRRDKVWIRVFVYLGILAIVMGGCLMVRA